MSSPCFSCLPKLDPCTAALHPLCFSVDSLHPGPSPPPHLRLPSPPSNPLPLRARIVEGNPSRTLVPSSPPVPTVSREPSFASGSNMCKRVVYERRGMRPVESVCAKLPDFRLCFMESLPCQCRAFSRHYFPSSLHFSYSLLSPCFRSSCLSLRMHRLSCHRALQTWSLAWSVVFPPWYLPFFSFFSFNHVSIDPPAGERPTLSRRRDPWSLAQADAA